MKRAWRLWALALGEKAGKHEKEADIIALVRTIVLILYMTTNVFIVAGVIRHWQKERPVEAGRCFMVNAKFRTNEVLACNEHHDR